MDCPRCLSPNLDGAAFCEECGAMLLVSAPDAAQLAQSVPAAVATQAVPRGLAQVTGKAITFVVHDPAGVTRIPFTGKELLCGRRDERIRIFPDIVLDDPAASRRHLALFADGGKLWAQDLESGNGTELNATQIVPGEPIELHHSDVLKIGEHVTIQVEII